MTKFQNTGARAVAIQTKTSPVILKPNQSANIDDAVLTEKTRAALIACGVVISDPEKSRGEQIAELTAEAESLGVEIKPQWGVPALQRAIEAKKQENAEAAAAKEGEGE